MTYYTAQLSPLERGETPIIRRKYHCARCGEHEKTMYLESGKCQYGHNTWITKDQILFEYSGVISRQKAMILNEVWNMLE